MGDKKSEKRYAFVKDAQASCAGFATQEDAAEWCRRNGLPNGEDNDTAERRVRVRLRQRTGLYDVVVKVKTEVKQTPRVETLGEVLADAHAEGEGLVG